ncbi:MAG: amidase [Proteobacteria bacterium SG_bin9]|nr:MAG: amidase [Proteobacteria bacterium SG_bin9]
MLNTNAKTGVAPEAGVLDLLQQFRGNTGAAESYAANLCQRIADAEPTLKAFTCQPVASPAAKAGPLAGIPVAIKDIIATHDMPTTNGSAVYKDHIPANDAWIVERLRSLGATIFGKTVSTEFAWRHPGPTTNPWNSKHTPGGSSSGSAASVAAGLAPLALGTQTLGSIIRPAAFNGVVGFKPSYGAIPRTGVHALSGSLDHVGFFARCVDDVAYALSLTAATSDSDRHGLPVPAFDVSAMDGLPLIAPPRLAVVRFSGWSRAEPEQQAVFNASIAKLKAAGATLEEVELPDLDRNAWATINTILASEGSALFSEIVTRHPDKTSDKLKELVKTGQAHSAHDYLLAKAKQAALRDSVAAQLSGFDAVLTLSAFGEAPEGLSYTGDAEYCAPWTLLGTPALSLPAGFGKKGLPLAVQVVGAYREDFKTLKTAKWIEQVLQFDPGLAPIK